MTKEGFPRMLSELEDIANVGRLTRNVDGWLTDIEGMSLYLAAKHGAGDGKIVEIGSFKGRSTIWLAKGSMAANREEVFAIDPHKGSSEHQPGAEFASHMPLSGTTEGVFRDNLRKTNVENWVEPRVMTSREARVGWSYPIRLLFIDGEHTYEAVKDDFLGWENHLVSGGILAFHDVDPWDGAATHLDGPSKVVYEDVSRTGFYTAPVLVNHIAYLIKH